MPRVVKKSFTPPMSEGRYLYWRTKKPYLDQSRKSPVFWIQDCQWYFELECNETYGDCYDYYDDYYHDYYNLYIRNSRDLNIPKPFVITTYISHESDERPRCFDVDSVRDTGEKIRSFKMSDISMRNFKSCRTMNIVILFHTGVDIKLHLVNEEDALCYRSHSCLECLSSDFSKLLNDDSYQDVQLNCGDYTVKAHKNVLSIRSKVFQAMLQSDMVEARTGVVDIRDMETDVFQKFLRYLYTGKLPEISSENAKRFYEIGDSYAVEGLMRLSAYVLIKNLTPENACEMLILADAHDDSHLREGVITYMIENKIPRQDDYWIPFSDSHPKLAVEVLNRAYKSKSM